MKRAAVLALVLVLAPRSAMAQEEAGTETVPEPPQADASISDADLIRWAANEVRLHEARPPSPPRPPIAPDSYLGTGVDGPVVLPDESERDALRLLAGLGGGALGVLVGGGLGVLLVWAAVEARANPDWMLVAAGAGTAMGAFAVTGGVVVAANAVGGRGNFGDAFIGQLIGSAAALPLVTLGMANDAPAVALVSAGLLPLCGAVLGYEISHAKRSSWQQLAYVTPTRGGAVAGVAGEMP